MPLGVNNVKSIFCFQCDKYVMADVREEILPVKVRGIQVNAAQAYAICPHCGDRIADEEMSRTNLDAPVHEYKKAQDLLSSAEIGESYSKYGLTQGSFAKLLGLGGATLSRYEHGAIQTRQIDQSIRNASTPDGMLALLESNGHVIPQAQMNHARAAALEMLAGNPEDASHVRYDAINLEINPSKDAPSELNGFKRLDFEKAMQMAVYLTEKCPGMGKTKLNKAFFYTDFVSFAVSSCSMSGLKYARAPYGPVANQHSALFEEMVKRGYLLEDRVSLGVLDASVFEPAVPFDRTLFSDEEFRILEKVADFINSFERASDLSEYSHQEDLWKNAQNGELISYMDAFSLKDIDAFLADI